MSGPAIDPALTIAEVMLATGMSRASVYRTVWLMQRCFIPRGTRGRRWRRSTVELFIAQRDAGIVLGGTRTISTPTRRSA